MGPTKASRLILIFAFAQALHYVAWLVWIPALRPAPWSRAAWLGVAAVSLLVPLEALHRPVEVRATYLSLVSFHAWFELAIAAHLLVRPRARAVADGVV